MKNRSGRVPRVTRASQNGVKIVNKSVREAFGAILDDSGRFWEALGTLRGRSGTLSGRSGTLLGGLGTLPGRSRNALGRSSDAFGTPRDRFFSQLARGTVFASIWIRFFVDFSVIFQSFRRSFFVRLTVNFSIGFRSFLRSKASSHVERSIIAEHRFFCAWAMFCKLFSKSRVFERTKKRWTRRSKIDCQVDRKNIEKSMGNRSQNRTTTRSNRRSKKGSKNLENRGISASKIEPWSVRASQNGVGQGSRNALGDRGDAVGGLPRGHVRGRHSWRPQQASYNVGSRRLLR